MGKGREGRAPDFGKDLLALLKRTDAELLCAAARVIGELDRAPAGTVDALEALLGASDNVQVRRYAMDALRRHGGERAAAILAGQLGEAGAAGEAAAKSMEALGAGAVEALLKVLSSGSPKARLEAARLLGRTGAEPAFDALFAALFDKDFDLVRAATDALKDAYTAAGAKEKAALLKRAGAFTGQKRAQKNVNALVSALILLGHTGEPAVTATLAAHLGKGRDERVQYHAMRGLLRLREVGPPHRKLADEAVKVLLDAKRSNLWEPASKLLRRLAVGKEIVPQLRKLAGHAKEGVRALTLEMLATRAGSAALPALIGALEDSAREVRESARHALRTDASFQAGVWKAFSGSRTSASARVLAEILREGGKPLSPSERKGLVGLVAGRAPAEPGMREIFLETLLALDREAGTAALLAEVRKKLGSKAEASNLHKLLGNPSIQHPEADYLRTVILLRYGQRTEREIGEASGVFTALAGRSDFPLATRIRKEKSVPPEAWLNLGFRLTEGVGMARQLGAELLKLAAKSGKKPVASTAKAKLRTEGLG